MKSEQIIMVVDKDILFEDDYFQGFQSADAADFESRIMNFKWMKRGIAEEDPKHKQPIGYVLVVNPKLKKVFAYRRAEKDYDEKRLQGKWSWGVGGHIEKHDSSGDNPIHDSMRRELKEEVKISGAVDLKVLGYINDDSDPVGKVHFGVLYLALTDAADVVPNNAEMAEGSLMTIEQLDSIIRSPNNQVENWSKIALVALKEYFKGH